jgi:FixJ family two-component response regulator
MPGLVGTDLAVQLRRIRPDVPIVLMSGYGASPLQERAREVGIRDVLRKPLQIRDIAGCLWRVLR